MGIKKIYKYVIPERIDILENQQIRITQPVYLNDPFDSVLSFKKIVEKKLFIKHFNASELFEKILENINQKLKEHNQNKGTNITLSMVLASKGKNIEDFKDVFFDRIEEFTELLTNENIITKQILNNELNNFMGVLSFTETPDNIPMWAYYADVHRGFVISFNAEHSFFNNGFIDDKDFGLLQKVNYQNEKTVLNSMKELKGNPFFEKHKSWENEKEWRLLLPLSSADITKYPDIYLVSIPSEIINSVIFGYRCNTELIEYVSKMKINNPVWKNLKLYKALPVFDEYKMKIEEIVSV